MKGNIQFAEEKIGLAFNELKNSKTEDQILYANISKAIAKIEEYLFSGVQLPKRLIPKSISRSIISIISGNIISPMDGGCCILLVKKGWLSLP